jgi:hypothetical protein
MEPCERHLRADVLTDGDKTVILRCGVGCDGRYLHVINALMAG